jgi:hypothetical protein
MRFTIRELVLLTLVVAMSVGWWVERRNNAPLRAEIESVREQLDTLARLVRDRGFEVFIDHEGVGLSGGPPWE